MTLKESYIQKLSKKVSLYEQASFEFQNMHRLSMRELKQILHAFEELEERIRVLEKAARAPCSKCDEYPCFTHFE